MTEKLELAYQFDFVFDGQKVFRELLTAISNPGVIKNIGEQAAKFMGNYSSLMALGCTLLDNEEKMYVEKNPRLSAELHNLTLSREAELGEADYIFLSSEMNYGSMDQILKNVQHGTYSDPQQAATIFLLCESVAGEKEMVLAGPGIKESLSVLVYPYIEKVICLRDSLRIEYPLGVDLIFVDGKGNLMAVPRLCKVVNGDRK